MAPQFFILALDGTELSALPPGKELPVFTVGWVSPRARLDAVEKRTFSLPYWESKPGRPVRSQSLYQLSCPVFFSNRCSLYIDTEVLSCEVRASHSGYF
jgi:hypothetical protein